MTAHTGSVSLETESEQIFIRPFVNHTKGSLYYCHGRRFKVLHL